jgi:hypothetical protein
MNLFRRFQQEKAPVTPGLEAKIQDASNRAGELVQQKKVANAPVSAGVP